ncbi:hypothetical protein DFA_10755 [Cavenderia fasciculata]|uniref:Uncharacterized protein n=1 Tax=Cavenderia fasciculata TaxID=261658 RepID=F4QBB0_CACFS|nr:uncharacterized protein DFA_10755 [Cavenderia fasciculata]EGG14882.1 hypothetical protein DFA_10755 [Cavenderia fasciculata]|eukprot:XP_004351398.1 hypothetical protein DFA_10755 [Cavenderia fasciculata]
MVDLSITHWQMVDQPIQRLQLISTTPSSDHDDCIDWYHIGSMSIDPDFTPLLTPSSGDDCNKADQKWKIIVGVVVGVIGGAAVAFILVVSAKRARWYYIRNRSATIKMKQTH